MKKFLSNLLTSFISILILLILLEVVVRVFIPKENYTLTSTAADWANDSIIGWRNKSNYEDLTFRHGKMIHYKTNADGFRPYTSEPEKDAGEVRVMLFGNSTVAARDVLEENTLHHLLDSLLDLSGTNFTVINAGVQGYSTDQVLLNIQQQVKKYQPDIACYGFCINDLYANLSGEYSGLHKPRFSIKNDELELQPLEKQNTDILKTTSEYSIRDLLQKSAFYGVMRPFIQQARIKYSEQAQLDQGGVNDFERYQKPWQEDEYFNLFSKLLAAMEEACEQNSTQFFLYAHPELVTVWQPYREATGGTDLPNDLIENRLQEIASHDSVQFVRMVDHFLVNKDKGPFHLLPRDPHCNGMGYLLQAEVLADYILTNCKKEESSISEAFVE